MSDTQQLVRKLALYLVPMILSLSVHEFSHALVASKLGDDTPEAEERLTLSPLSHIDPWGTLIVPIVSILSAGYAFIGWARPVNVNPARFRRGVSMRGGMALTAVAGPLSNLLLAVLSVAALTILAKTGTLHRMASGPTILVLLQAMFSVNVGLAVFNLLPIPPLDGSRLLPRSADAFVEKMGQYSFLLVLLILWVRPLRETLIEAPIELITRGILALFGNV